MNPHTEPGYGPASLLQSLTSNLRLIQQMAWREIIGRYKGSAFGLAWSIINPLFMLAVYTFVFSVVFQARWGQSDVASGKAEFALVLFAGLIVHGFLAEVMNRSPDLVLNNANYVKKVVFPLEILPVIGVVSALFHTTMSLLILLATELAIYGQLQPTILLIPIVILPLCLFALGISWILASLGVYLRDVGQLTAIVTTILLFVSPVFFPVSAIPEPYRVLVLLNPLTFIIEQARNVLLWGKQPDWQAYAIYLVFASTVALSGYMWFQKTRKGFADVI